MKLLKWSVFLITISLFIACTPEEDPCDTNNSGYIVVRNGLSGIDAEAMDIEINNEYIGNIAPGGETQAVERPSGGTYEIKGSTTSGAVYFESHTVEQCFEDVITLGD